MERTPKRRSLTIDPRRESLLINGEYRLLVRPHGKRLVVNVERIGESVVLVAEKLDEAIPPKVD